MGAVTDLYLVARTTFDGWRELYYYVADPAAIAKVLDDTIAQGESKLPFEFKILKDPEWVKFPELVSDVEKM